MNEIHQPKVCIDCKHSIGENSILELRCLKTKHRHRITGEESAFTCEATREEVLLCGPTAKWFEGKI